MIIIEKQLLDRMKEDAESKYPEECCGILLGRRMETRKRIVGEVHPAANEADNRRERQFQIDPLTLLKAERYADETGMEIIGFYHSHPDCQAKASVQDERFALPDFSYLILSVIHGAVCDIQGWTLTEKSEYNSPMFHEEPILYRERGEEILCQ